MSLATRALGVLARSKHGHVSVVWTTSRFCAYLEKVVEYMQDPSSNSRQLEALTFSKEFLGLVWRAINAGRFYMLACVVMLFYDYVVTVDLEVEHIWRRKKTIIAYLFYINRYLPLATYLFVIVSVFSSNASSYFCLHVFASLPPVMIVMSEAVIGLLRMAKVRALWINELNRGYCLVTIVLYLVQTALAIASASAVQGVGPLFGQDNRIGCFIIFHSGSMPRLVLHWFANLVFNIIIFCFILRKALAVRRAGGDASLADILVRDAITFLVVLSIVKIGNLIMLIIFPYWNAINWSFNNIADVILTSRLIFNLRAATKDPLATDETDTSQTGILGHVSETESYASGNSYDIEAPAVPEKESDSSNVIYLGPERMDAL